MHIKYALNGYRKHFEKHPLEKRTMTDKELVAIAMKEALSEKGDIYGPGPAVQRKLQEAITALEKSPGEMRPMMQPIGMIRAKEPTIDKAAASIADMMNEWLGLSLSKERQDTMAALIEARLARFWPYENEVEPEMTDAQMANLGNDPTVKV